MKSKEYRLLGNYKYCNQPIFGTHHNKLQAHQRFCSQNPNRNKAVQQFKDFAKKGSDISHANKSARSKILNEKHKHTLICAKCNKPYDIWISDRDFEKGEYKKHCSYSCANSRNIKAVAPKISASVKQKRPHKCPKCGKEFIHRGTAINSVYCDDCFLLIYGRSRDELIANKQTKIFGSCGPHTKIGNNMPLHETTCKECGKKLWCKTSDDVYCYECVDKLGKVIHQLYTCTGKKLVSRKTKAKLKKNMQDRIANGTHNGWMNRTNQSYPEKFWETVLINNNISYETEASVQGYLYSLDFKICLDNGVIIDLEIDGKQHYYVDRNQHDILRDKRIRSLGYLVYRVKWNDIKTKIGKSRMKAKIKQFLWWLDKVRK